MKTKQPAFSGTTSLNAVMLIALLVVIPLGAVMWYLGSLRNQMNLKIAGMCLQVSSYSTIFTTIFTQNWKNLGIRKKLAT
jgi:hypothetical protein